MYLDLVVFIIPITDTGPETHNIIIAPESTERLL